MTWIWKDELLSTSHDNSWSCNNNGVTKRTNSATTILIRPSISNLYHLLKFIWYFYALSTCYIWSMISEPRNGRMNFLIFTRHCFWYKDKQSNEQIHYPKKVVFSWHKLLSPIDMEHGTVYTSWAPTILNSLIWLASRWKWEICIQMQQERV